MTPARPTILQIVPDLETGGAELSAVEIAAAIAAAGGRALVLSRGGRMEADLAAAGGELVRFPAATKNPVQMLANANAIARMIRDENVAIVHARSRAPAWSAMIAARRTGVPFVTTYHGAYNETGPFKRAYNSVMARGALVIANSNYTAELIQSRYGTPTARLRVIHRGVDMDRFTAERIDPGRVAALRTAWGLEGRVRALLQPARLTSWKGQTTVIAAAAHLKSQGQLEGLVFILAGDAQGRTAYEQALRDQIAASGLEDQVRLVGHVADMPAALLACEGAIVASTEPEAFGRTATEAQALGRPVIATRIGAPPETVLAPPAVDAGHRTGWLVPPGDVLALAAAITELTSLPDEARTDLALRARERVAGEFSLHAMKQKTMAVYDELIDAGLEKAYLRKSRS